MKLMFCTSNLPGAILIRSVTWSRWSHVAVLIDDNTCIEAVWPRVKYSSVEEVKQKHPKWCIVDFDVPDEAAAINFAKLQVGKRYDVTALFGILIHRDWAQDSDWFCSEYAAATLEAGKKNIFRHDIVKRIVPEMLWMLDNPVIEESK